MGRRAIAANEHKLLQALVKHSYVLAGPHAQPWLVSHDVKRKVSLRHRLDGGHHLAVCRHHFVANRDAQAHPLLPNQLAAGIASHGVTLQLAHGAAKVVQLFQAGSNGVCYQHGDRAAGSLRDSKRRDIDRRSSYVVEPAHMRVVSTEPGIKIDLQVCPSSTGRPALTLSDKAQGDLGELRFTKRIRLQACA